MDKIKISYGHIYKFLLFIWILFIPMKDSIYQIAITLLLCIFLLELSYRNNRIILRALISQYKDTAFALVFIIASMSVSNILGIHAPKAWHLETMYLLRYGLIFFILLYGYSKNYFSLFTLTMMIVVSLSLQTFDGLYQHFFNIDFLRGTVVEDGEWLTGAVFYYNPFGMIMGLGAGIILTLLINNYKQTIIPSTLGIAGLLFLLCSFLYTMLFSLSRASWIAFIAFVATLIVLNYKHISKKFLLGFCIITLCIVLFALIDASLLHRITQLLQGDSSNRYDIWRSTLKAFNQSPYFGYGLDCFKFAVPSQSQFNGVHNSLLEILLCLGIVGLCVFSYALFLSLREIYRQKASHYFAFFMFLMVVSQFDHSIISSKIFLSILTLFTFFVFSHRQTTKLS